MPERAERPARANGTVLAFDFGLKRIGVAVGEGETGTAHPLPAISGFSQVEKLLKEWNPDTIVVGRPTSVDGTPHTMTRQAEDFARRIERRFKLPVARVDERYTSVEAQSRLKGLKNKKIDSVAAQLILEQYFDAAA